MSKNQVGVLLLGFGAPDSLDQVEPFLRNIFSSQGRDVPLDVFQGYLKKAIERYKKIGGRSPLLDITKSQAEALEKKLKEQDGSFKVYIGMRNCPPFIEKTLNKIVGDGIQKMVALSLSPQYNSATAGSNIRELKNIFKEIDAEVDVTYIDSWCDNSTYLDALSDKVKQGFSQFTNTKQDQIPVLFSAHSLPKRLIERGDPYLGELEKTIDGVLKRVGKLNWRLCFQSRGKVGEWLEPSISDVIKRLAKEGHKEILVVPLSFIADNVEVLYDIDVALKKQAKEVGVSALERIESLNDSPKFIEALAEIVLELVEEKD